ncbi:hypothetical protein ACFVUY_26605 [Kitasatospora sp. NPDC058063]|uniref:hypothetical protein n=1 Tax=unclassified Kitasatospora TaxID=2633591 RepID=UPI0036DD1354
MVELWVLWRFNFTTPGWKGVMSVPAEYELTDAQKKARDEVLDELDKVEARLREVQAKARRQLPENIDGDSGSNRCFRCDCPTFEISSSGPSAVCSRSSCGHGFNDHDFF